MIIDLEVVVSPKTCNFWVEAVSGDDVAPVGGDER